MIEEINDKIAHIEEQHRQIEIRVVELEKWVEIWKEVLHLMADSIEKAKRNNATLALKEVINPWSETTTVEDLLHMLESECPVMIVTDAISKKELTAEESKRLASDLEYIIEEANKTLATLR